MDGEAEVEREVEVLDRLGSQAYCEMFKLQATLEHTKMAYKKVKVENEHL